MDLWSYFSEPQELLSGSCLELYQGILESPITLLKTALIWSTANVLLLIYYTFQFVYFHFFFHFVETFFYKAVLHSSYSFGIKGNVAFSPSYFINFNWNAKHYYFDISLIVSLYMYRSEKQTINGQKLSLFEEKKKNSQIYNSI